jgi:hypothetical protein
MEVATTPPTSPDVNDTQESSWPPLQIFAGPDYLIDLDDTQKPYTREQIYAGPMSTQPNFLTTLPLEIVYNILDYMWLQDEYANMACTCRLALRLTNSQVDSKQPFSWDIGDSCIPDIYFARNISSAVACRKLRDVENNTKHEFDTCCLGGESLADEDPADIWDSRLLADDFEPVYDMLADM